ncbi:hypothetical protein ABTZ99_11850 [Actinosynnema sp. NPDC002837]
MNVQLYTTRDARPRRARWRAGLAAAAGVTALAATLVAWPITTASAAVGAGTYTVKNVWDSVAQLDMRWSSMVSHRDRRDG